MADPATLAARIDRLESAGQIRQLAWRYSATLDRRDMDGLMGLYADDVELPGGRRGRDALRELMEPSLRRVRTTILHVGNHVIEFTDDDQATGAVYCHGEVQTGPDTWVHQAICYGDRYVRRDGRWYFAAQRRHELFYGAAHGRRPVGMAAADWPAHDTGTGTLPYRWDSWQRFWAAQPPA
ncbi:MAG TPA: nuclear transport factor 2 family protein [Acidimicrobiales bacterium]|nr:nuclear transport factor 2 family protein [Acidimicrobiales bacterium]